MVEKSAYIQTPRQMPHADECVLASFGPSNKASHLIDYMSVHIRFDLERYLLISKRKWSHTHNPLMTHLNINHLRYRIIDLRKIISYTGTDLISITETKIDASFPNALKII